MNRPSTPDTLNRTKATKRRSFAENPLQQIYLDYNATTPVDPEVQDAIIPFLREHFGNPSSSHSLGRACKEAIEEARGRVATLLNAEHDEIYFTSGGTESNNLVIKGIFFQQENQTANFVTSSFEHPAISVPALFHEEMGGTVTKVGCNEHGLIAVESVEHAIQSDTKLVSIMHANNEIGSLQPISEIGSICKEHNILFHTDASQSVGKVRTDVEKLGVDFLTIAGHKLYAPKGIGALYMRQGTDLIPSVHGANHERGVRPGTENTPYIVGLGVAAKIALKKLNATINLQAKQRDRLEALLKQEIGDHLTINAQKTDRLPNTSSVNFPHVNAANMLKRVPELCVSTGAACHSDSVSLSATLQSIGLSEEVGKGTIRISLGRYTTDDEIDLAASHLISAWESTHE